MRELGWRHFCSIGPELAKASGIETPRREDLLKRSASEERIEIDGEQAGLGSSTGWCQRWRVSTRARIMQKP